MPVKSDPLTVLLVEADVIIRLVLAEHSRACGVAVIEAANSQEARAVLVAGPAVQILMADAQLAGSDDTGFALAQWCRRYRPQMEVILTASIAHKAQAASGFCARFPDYKGPEAAILSQKLHAMLAERRRRLRPSAPNAELQLKRRRR